MGKRFRFMGIFLSVLFFSPIQNTMGNNVPVANVRNPVVVLDHLTKNTSALLDQVRKLVREDPAIMAGWIQTYSQHRTVFNRVLPGMPQQFSWGWRQAYTSYMNARGAYAARGRVLRIQRGANLLQIRDQQFIQLRHAFYRTFPMVKAAIVRPFLKLNDEALRLYELAFLMAPYQGPGYPAQFANPFQSGFYAMDYMGFRNMMFSLWVLADGLQRVYYTAGNQRLAMRNPVHLQMRISAINHYARNVYTLMHIIRDLQTYRFGYAAAFQRGGNQQWNCYFATHPFRPITLGRFFAVTGQGNQAQAFAPYPLYTGTFDQQGINLQRVQNQYFTPAGQNQFIAPTPRGPQQNFRFNYDFNNWQHRPQIQPAPQPVVPQGNVQPGTPLQPQQPGAQVGDGNNNNIPDSIDPFAAPSIQPPAGQPAPGLLPIPGGGQGGGQQGQPAGPQLPQGTQM